MSEGVASTIQRNAFRFALTGLVGIWLSGCADATRFGDAGNPFSNPFAAASTQSSAPTPSISSKPLAAAKPYNHNYATAASPSPGGVTSSHVQAPESTGAIRSPSAPVGGSAAGWSAVGGSPIVVGANDDARSLSDRYEVPEAALLSANGLHSASEVRPNMRIVVPVYNARGGAGAKDVQTARSEEPRAVKSREPRDLDSQRSAKDGEDGVKSKAHKAEAKRDDDSDDDSVKAKHADAKKHKSDADASDEPAKTHKKSAKAEDSASEKVASDKRKPEKHAEDAPKPDKHAKDTTAKAQTPAVAKADPPKSVDSTPTGNLQTASAGQDGDSKFRWPARGRIIQAFKVGGNDGINISLPEGTSVRAAEDGKVAYAGSALKGYGNLVLIRHPNGYVTAYANNGELDVKSGDTVKRGQVIAKSGETGDVSSPQLHFEVRKGQTPVDPTSYLAGL